MFHFAENSRHLACRHVQTVFLGCRMTVSFSLWNGIKQQVLHLMASVQYLKSLSVETSFMRRSLNATKLYMRRTSIFDTNGIPHILFFRSYKFYLSTVGSGFTSKNASKENYRIILRLQQSEAANILKIKLQRTKRNLAGRDDENKMSNFIVFRSAAAVMKIRV